MKLTMSEPTDKELADDVRRAAVVLAQAAQRALEAGLRVEIDETRGFTEDSCAIYREVVIVSATCTREV